MTRCGGFGRSALFAAGAAVGWLAWAVLAGPLLGVWHALAVYLVIATTLYVSALPGRAGTPPAPLHRARRAVIGGGAALLAAGIALLAHGTVELAIGLAAVIGLARSAFLYRAAPTRAVVTEVVLLGGGLLFARALASASLASVALALWGFLLVQSCFFLSPAVRVRAAARRDVDPFEEAHRRAVAVLEHDPT